MTRTVAFDEAGHTGEDLLNPDQPVFTLASVLLSKASASRLVRSSGKELHFKAARRSRAGRDTILRLLTDPALSPETVRTVAIHKRYSVVAKMVDLLVEPLASARGYDLYAQGEHRALSNLLFMSLPVTLGLDNASRLFRTFVGMCREPTLQRRERFILEVGGLASRAEPAAVQWLRLLAEGAAMGEFGGGELPDLDPAPPCLMALAHAWAADREPFEILHDDRRELQRWEPFLALFWRRTAKPETFALYDGRSVSYPLPVTELKVAASHADARLQAADVVAGSLQFVLSAEISRCPDPVFATRLKDETPLISWITDSTVWPTQDFGPTELGVWPGATPNVIDAIAEWTHRQD